MNFLFPILTDLCTPLPPIPEADAAELPYIVGQRRSEFRLELMQATGRTCRYCGRRIGKKGSPTLDHLLPWSRGGGHWKSNLVLACHPCNNAKRDLTVREWLGALTEALQVLTATT